MIRVLNCRSGKHQGATYVGRPSVLGNPYEIGLGITRELAVELHREWLMAVLWGSERNNPQYVAIRGAFYDLVDMVIAGIPVALECWCVPLLCHATTVAELVMAEATLRLAKGGDMSINTPWRYTVLVALSPVWPKLVPLPAIGETIDQVVARLPHDVDPCFRLLCLKAMSCNNWWEFRSKLVCSAADLKAVLGTIDRIIDGVDL